MINEIIIALLLKINLYFNLYFNINIPKVLSCRQLFQIMLYFSARGTTKSELTKGSPVQKLKLQICKKGNRIKHFAKPTLTTFVIVGIFIASFLPYFVLEVFIISKDSRLLVSHISTVNAHQ